MMNIRLQHDTTNVDWNLVVTILQKVGMAYHTSEIHRRAFANSHTVVFAFDGELLVGFGRAISDGEYQAAIYDVAVHPDYQGNRIGKMILHDIVQSIPSCSFILYASPGKEKFYEKEGFRRMKTGMALFVSSERMQKNGFTE
ncbi:GNAT family N-acetyltransferase [uncultured Acetobacteroides sp.]|uniref:GNAT family N-acetyltransferase n=1 Tax=uncultured Acetobacteroides sp. TaxID=1760811 RepID=UPI0029F470C6|nr:GNAT family N-acetyltransferase [uncultured Acetobacteroides sp.]